MPWIEVGGTDIYYVEEGKGQPLVFLHGMSSCGEAWFQQFAHFSDRYRCIAYDSVNHGHSSNSPHDEDEPNRADELEGFLAAMGIEQPILAGNSMGANTIIRWAVRHPGDAKALIPSGMGVPTGDGPAPRIAAEPLDKETLFLPIGDSLTDGFKAAQPRMYERYLRIRSTATRLEALRHPRRVTRGLLGDPAEMAAGVPKITSPMLVVVGGLDRLVPWAEHLHQLVPGSEYHVIEGAPHNVYYEAAAAYNARVDAFLAKVG
ncbi:MAG: alpha/beta hydrolase [Dehalococcoidia bacterium]|nr:alpha/beta hydrolase [Dehalococcoidia bacterium]